MAAFELCGMFCEAGGDAFGEIGGGPASALKARFQRHLRVQIIGVTCGHTSWRPPLLFAQAERGAGRGTGRPGVSLAEFLQAALFRLW